MMVSKDRLTLDEFNLVKSCIVREFDREINKRINIEFFNLVPNIDLTNEDKKENTKNTEKFDIKEQCGLKLYAELFKIYSDYNSYGRYTSLCIEYMIKTLSANNELTEMFLNIAHEVGIIFSTDNLFIGKLIETLKNGYSLISINPSDENTSILDKNILFTIYIEGSVIGDFLKNNFPYLVIVLIFSYFDESEFYRKYNECYKGKK